MEKKPVIVTFDPKILTVDTFGEMADFWYNEHKNHVQQSTAENDYYSVEKLKSTFGSMTLAEITPYHIEEYLRAAMKCGLSQSSIAKLRSIAGRIMKKAESFDLIDKNPVYLADSIHGKTVFQNPFEQDNQKDAFTLTEIRQLFANLPKNKIGCSIILLLCSGMRSQELLALEPVHINDTGTVIHIRQAVKLFHGKPSVGPPKSISSYRDIPLPRIAQEYALSLRNGVTGKYLVSGYHTDQPYNPKAYRKIYYHYLEAAGVRKLSPHCCRHTYISQLQHSGANIDVIRTLAGHSKENQTRHYLHVQNQVQLDAVAKLNNLFSQ